MPRVMVFMDGSNLHWARRIYNQQNRTDLKIDYQKFVNVIVGNRELVRAIYYCSKPDSPSEGQQKFIAYLRSIGIQVVEKLLKTRTDVVTKRMFSVEKGVDVALAVDLVQLAWENAYDVALIVSGDSDYIGAIRVIMSKGKNVEVVSFKNALSRELREAALRTVFIDDIVPQIIAT